MKHKHDKPETNVICCLHAMDVKMVECMGDKTNEEGLSITYLRRHFIVVASIVLSFRNMAVRILKEAIK